MTHPLTPTLTSTPTAVAAAVPAEGFDRTGTGAPGRLRILRGRAPRIMRV
ncbi:hypothetical protein [Streptomyces sp. NPDC059466]